VLFNVLGRVAGFECDLIRLRTREGMKVAEAKGAVGGKQPELNRHEGAHLVSVVHSAEYSTLEVAELFGVGRSTVHGARDDNALRSEPASRRLRDTPTPPRERRRPVPDTPTGRRRRDALEGCQRPL
jgi:DNA invertase Pin-like site-specific DNA recombinase